MHLPSHNNKTPGRFVGKVFLAGYIWHRFICCVIIRISIANSNGIVSFTFSCFHTLRKVNKLHNTWLFAYKNTNQTTPLSLSLSLTHTYAHAHTRWKISSRKLALLVFSHVTSFPPCPIPGDQTHLYVREAWPPAISKQKRAQLTPLLRCAMQTEACDYSTILRRQPSTPLQPQPPETPHTQPAHHHHPPTASPPWQIHLSLK